VQVIFRKLGVRNREEASAHAARLGLPGRKSPVRSNLNSARRAS